MTTAKAMLVAMVIVGGCSSQGVPAATSDLCSWSLSAPMQASGSTNTAWPGGVPADSSPRCNPADGSNGYAASVGIWAPPVALTLNLQEGVNDVTVWQDFTLNGCQSWRNGSAFVSVDGNIVTTNVVADCTTADMHADVTVIYRKSK